MYNGKIFKYFPRQSNNFTNAYHVAQSSIDDEVLVLCNSLKRYNVLYHRSRTSRTFLAQFFVSFNFDRNFHVFNPFLRGESGQYSVRRGGIGLRLPKLLCLREFEPWPSLDIALSTCACISIRHEGQSETQAVAPTHKTGPASRPARSQSWMPGRRSSKADWTTARLDLLLQPLPTSSQSWNFGGDAISSYDSKNSFFWQWKPARQLESA